MSSTTGSSSRRKRNTAANTAITEPMARAAGHRPRVAMKSSASGVAV